MTAPEQSSTATAQQSPQPPADVPLIRNVPFQALWISQFAAAIGKEAAEVAYPLFVLATTGSAFLASAVGSAQLVAVGVMSIPGGTLGDRFDRRTILVVCTLIRLGFLLSFGLLVAAGVRSTAPAFVAAVGSSICLGLSNPSALAAIKQLVPPSQLKRATAQSQIRPFAATTIGSPIGSSLFAVGRAVPFLATAMAFGLSALALMFTKPMRAVSASKAATRLKTIDGYRFIRTQPIILLWLIWVIGSNMAFNHTGSFLAVIATAKSRHASDSLIGLTLGIAGVGGVVGSAVAMWLVKHVRPSIIFVVAAWLGPVAAILLVSVHGVLPLGIILACVFVRAPVVNALFFAYIAALVPNDLQARVIGAATFASFIAMPIGILGVGAIFSHGGPTWVFTAMGVTAALAATPTLTHRMRHLPDPEDLAT